MIKGLMMNNLLLINRFPTIKLFVLIYAAMLLNACAGPNIVNLESNVEQLKNLNDLDRDGVIEAREKCADTVLGASIDNYGCGTRTSITRPVKVDIKFAHNSYVIPPEALPQIQKLATFLQDNPELEIVIEGHSSKVGGRKLNQKLSYNRAKAVVLVLVNELNIPLERVSAVGYGFDRLADFEDTEKAHSTNRRIMAELSQTVHVDDMIWTIYTVDQVQ